MAAVARAVRFGCGNPDLHAPEPGAGRAGRNIRDFAADSQPRDIGHHAAHQESARAVRSHRRGPGRTMPVPRRREDRKSVVKGKREENGGRRNTKKKKKKKKQKKNKK